MNTLKRIYSKLTIVLFSIFGGAVLYSINLKETKNSKFITPTIIFSILYLLLFIYISPKLTLVFGVSIFCIYYLMNLLGGLLLIGPLWKYQIGDIENIEKRKIWVPLAIFIVIIALSLFIQINKHPNNLNAREFQNATNIEAQKQIKNKLFVLKDSSAMFFDLSIPLLESSYMFKTQVEDVNTFFDYKDYDEGRFSTICTRIPLKDNDVFSIDLLGKEFSSLIVKKCNNRQFESMICANYIKKVNDTLSVKGMIAMIKIDRISYHFLTQYKNFDKTRADSISTYLISKIKIIKKKYYHQ